MAYVPSDRTKDIGLIKGTKDYLSMIRGALIDEISATDLYDRLSQLIPSEKEILQEIKRDELNHQGRLMEILMRLDPQQLVPFNKGYEQKD